MKRGNNLSPANKRPQPLSKTVSLSALLPGDTQFVSDLKSNRYEYITNSQDPTISIRNFPRSIKLNIDRLKSSLNNDTNTPFSSNIILHAAIVNGLKFYESHPDVKSLIEIREQFFQISDEVDEEVALVLSGFFEDMKIDLFEKGGGKFTTIKISSHIQNSIVNLKQSTELSLTDLTLLCIIHSILNEDSTIRGHRDKFQRKEEQFFLKAKIRAEGLTALLKCYKLI